MVKLRKDQEGAPPDAVRTEMFAAGCDVLSWMRQRVIGIPSTAGYEVSDCAPLKYQRQRRLR